MMRRTIKDEAVPAQLTAAEEQQLISERVVQNACFYVDMFTS